MPSAENRAFFRIYFKLRYLTQYCMGPYEIQKILARLAQYLLHWWKALGFFFPPIKWSPGFDGRCLQQSLSYSKILNRWKWMGKEWYVCFYSPSFSKPFFGVTSTSTLSVVTFLKQQFHSYENVWVCHGWSFYISLSQGGLIHMCYYKIKFHDDIWSKPFWK